MTKKQKKEYAIKKAISILTCDNPVPMIWIIELADKLKAMELADLGVIIASQYSPEGNMKWQQLLEA